jgi:hypothetical protein
VHTREAIHQHCAFGSAHVYVQSPWWMWAREFCRPAKAEKAFDFGTCRDEAHACAPSWIFFYIHCGCAAEHSIRRARSSSSVARCSWILVRRSLRFH